TLIRTSCANSNWLIAVCDATLDSNGIPRSNNYNVGKVTEESDLLGVLMHEFGHVQGLHHPGVGDPNASDVYCDGDAAVLGGSYCGSMHAMSRRDLYRYDTYCAWSRNTLRELTLNRLIQIGSAFGHGNDSSEPKYSNVSVWQGTKSSVPVHVDVRNPINSFFREARQLGTGMPLLESWQEDESLRTGQTLIMGIPTSSSKTRS